MPTPPDALPAAPTLVLVCKRPALGHGKQRLARRLGPEATLPIAEALLACALEDLAAWPGPQVIAPDRAEDADWARQQAPAAHCQAQGGGNLGERLNTLDRQLRAQGHGVLVIIGSDIPALTPALYAEVRAALTEVDTVLVPACDGGVVLMASRQPWPALAGLPWSTPALGDALQALCEAAGQQVRRVGLCRDVDEPADLLAAYQALAEDLRPARRALRAQLLPLLEHCR
ncbi:DUF2064 domain-containing protein [Pseudomonas sp. NW5]|uniref:DUF2064 domain-containing protein n=1 Tax=Pseudomonas sp. NW5 TaxID=2934934 RepID=UPI00201FCA9B|nr:DUF2064 domain-containing protein [Pseudomonas sp. NW5]MCL7462505.1 DUF2064 domain-containing protein [Pseudomonas sp. NW5]